MINYDSTFNLSSGVTCNWCIQLDALQIITLSSIVEFIVFLNVKKSMLLILI